MARIRAVCVCVCHRRSYDAPPMWKVLAHSSTTYDSVAPPYMAESAEASASSSVADPVTHASADLVHRPTFGISLNELKAAIAPRAVHLQDSLDEADRFSSSPLLYSFTNPALNDSCEVNHLSHRR